MASERQESGFGLPEPVSEATLNFFKPEFRGFQVVFKF
jgi:hypothetical protein